GVLDDGLESMTPRAVRILTKADRVIADTRFLFQFRSLIPDAAERVPLAGRIAKVPEWINETVDQGGLVVVLATGDPLCYGIGAYLSRKMPEGSFRVLGAPSTMQRAFEALTKSWSGAARVSIHSRESGEWQRDSDEEHALYPLWKSVQREQLVGVFTSPDNGPDRIARLLITEGWADHFLLHVVENIGRPEEMRFRDLTPVHAAEERFRTPNIAIVERLSDASRNGSASVSLSLPLIGLEDADYLRGDGPTVTGGPPGLVTRKEIRAVALAEMGLRRQSIVWDIGAGSGSVGLEAARMADQGAVFAIEKHPDRLRWIEANRQRLGVRNYQLVEGAAPDETMETWPDPDAIFIGGSGGRLIALIRLCYQRLLPGGRLVMNFIALENLNTTLDTLKALTIPWRLSQISVARSRPILEMHRLMPETPVWVVTVEKG
ncbi:MAG: precorrin-6y C5,15-methyltransferase (decarboxylating) subunit CbiE, partial [Magnetococcales bacterium]|nr:precorrin-6y C5,15-methyltransferase (decarboxylating) subunit CbiE [Magnetococcales bacterium]